MTKKKSGFSKSELIFKVTRPGERASSRPRDSHHESASAISHPVFRETRQKEVDSLNLLLAVLINIIVERDLRQ